jgi:GDP-D-mannose dehydratase
VLDWKPTVTFKQLVRIMLEADLKLVGFDPDKVIKR